MIYPWQQKQWQQLAQQREQKRLPHALLFHGPAGTGKKHFASELARSLLCKQPGEEGTACGHCDSCKLIAAGTHPDCRVITPTPPPNSTSKTPVLSIKIDALRDMYRAMSETSQFGGYRIAIIEDADKMPTQAANSLLKTLEEPGPDTALILVSSHPYKLPVTIRSRCQALAFDTPDSSMAIEWLQQSGVTDPQIALKLSHGGPIQARSFVENQAEQRELLVQALNAGSSGTSSIQYAQKLAQIPKEPLLAWMLDWVSDLGRLLTCGSDAELVNEDQRMALQARAQQADVRKVFGLHDQVCALIRAEGIALNPQLFWENLLISWENI